MERFKKIKKRLQKKGKDFLARRPHRSFRLTRRRDYKRSFDLPGYWAFTYEVWQTVWRYRWLYLTFFIVYIISALLVIGLVSTESYNQLSDVIFGKNEEVGLLDDFGAVTSALSLFAATVAGSMSAATSQSQQLASGLVVLMGWLTLVWMLRQRMAGHKIKFRDALYSSGAPIVSTFIVVVVLIIQLIPLALGLIAYNVAAGGGLFDSGVEAMAIWVGIVLLAILSLYFATSSFIALIIVTLPGMYPFKALKTAGDLVVGRRLKVMLRLGWVALGILPTWAIILIPLIFLQGWLRWEFPVVPFAALIVSSATLIWSATYIYLLYRKLINDPAPPA